MNVLQLNRSHLEPVRELLLGQKNFFGVPVDTMPIKVNTEAAVVTYSNQYLSDDTHFYRSFGSFDDEGNLVGILNADFNQNMPYWIVRRLAVQEHLKGSEGVAASQALITHATLLAESFGYFQHYSLVPAKYSRVHGRLWATNPVRRNRYVVRELETIEPGQQSKYRMFWESLFGRVVYPIATTVRFSLCLAQTPVNSGEQDEDMVDFQVLPDVS